MISPNDFDGNDTLKIRQAVAAAEVSGRRCVRISRRKADALSARDFWLIDEAILLPGDMELIIDDCKIKLSDSCRDNFIRSANCGSGISDISVLSNIRISGRGRAVLEGADHPRSTGDAGKTLGIRTYGTDAARPEEKQTGDWRNVGILLVLVENFSITGLEIRDYHCWGISLEKCACGEVKDIHFNTREKRLIDGKEETVLNQDGLDIRKGCRHISVENITGRSGDDLVALTAIHPEIKEAGTFVYTELSGCPDPPANNDIHDIHLKHIHGYSAGGHQIVRLLNACGLRIHDVTIEDVRDTSADDPEQIRDAAAVKIGDKNPVWGGVTPLGDTFNITVENVDSRARHCVLIAGSLCDSRIGGIINRNVDCSAVECTSGEENLRNVEIAPQREMLPAEKGEEERWKRNANGRGAGSMPV